MKKLKKKISVNFLFFVLTTSGALVKVSKCINLLLKIPELTTLSSDSRTKVKKETKLLVK